MKVCLSTNCDYNYLKDADAIKFKYKDRKGIERYTERYPDAEIILEHNVLTDESIDWKFINETKILSKKENITLCLNNIEEAREAKENGFDFFLNYTITSFFELEGVLGLGPKYIKLGAPLFFMKDKVKEFTTVPIIAAPNIAYADGLPHENGIHGTWIRPESIGLYEDFIDIIYFEDCDARKEQALYRLYILGQEWPGELNELITNLKASATNRMILNESMEKRLNCGQKCVGGSCHICDTTFLLADPNLIRDYIKVLKEKEKKEKTEL